MRNAAAAPLPSLAAIALFATLAGCSLYPPRGASPPAEVPATIPPVVPPASLADPRQRFVEAALSMLGRPYQYGGAGPAGFDCSGLVDYAARRAGLSVPRTAALQFGAGRAITQAEMLPGDLVFMRLKRDLHVGIVTASGQFVHAPSQGGHVRIDRLDARPYRDSLIGVRRVSP